MLAAWNKEYVTRVVAGDGVKPLKVFLNNKEESVEALKESFPHHFEGVQDIATTPVHFSESGKQHSENVDALNDEAGFPPKKMRKEGNEQVIDIDGEDKTSKNLNSCFYRIFF